MRILFVSGTSEGGSARSTEQLAARLHARGHDVATLMGWRPRPRPRQIERADGRAVYAAFAFHAGRVERVIRRQLDQRPHSVDRSTYPMWRARFPGGCVPMVCAEHRPDVVVATSLDPRTWRTMRAYLAGAGIASVLYLRTAGTVQHLAAGPRPDLVLSNAQALADAARAIGVNAVVVPSVVDLDRCRVESTRRCVLFVNPIARRGLPTALAMASARPAIPFVIHETAALSRSDRGRLRAQIGPLANVDARPPVADPRALYADARVLLAPYMISNRPRVVLEAQSNAIPVLATDIPGLRECVPPGGVLVPADAPVDRWVRALDDLWDPVRYAGLAAAARRHSARPEVQASTIVDRFEEVLVDLLERRAQLPRERS